MGLFWYYSYPAIEKWMKHLYYDIPGFKETTNFEHIKKVKKILGEWCTS